MKLVILDGYTLNPGDLSWEQLQAYGDLTVYDRSTDQAAVIRRARQADILFTNKTPLPRAVLEALPDLHYIGVLATGYNVVDTLAAAEQGVVVTNIPHYGTRSVAQMTLAHLLEICHHVGSHHASVVRGDWTHRGDFCYWNHPLIELEGKLMGIIGLGRIGLAVARLAQAFGMQILATDPHANPPPEDLIERVSLQELLARSDVISLHCPLSDETHHLINRETIARMKDGVILINTSRGQLIAENDLASALQSGKIAAAGLDVLENEPPPRNHILFSQPNCLITPHISWAPRESRIRLMNQAEQNLKAFLAGNPIHVVN